MLAGSMGEGAKNKLEGHNIRVIRGCSGAVEAVAEAFLKGFVFDSGVGCVAHECGEHKD
jgi:predicted Fe-Mo cluster-binding NifX family protein